MGMHPPFDCHMEKNPNNSSIPFRDGYRDGFTNETLPLFLELTEEQQLEINSLRENMSAEGSSPQEIRDAIAAKLQEFGIDFPTRDDMLDREIEQTTQRLNILERQKELREAGYSWDEIHDLIAEEFGINFSGDVQPHSLYGDVCPQAHNKGGVGHTFANDGTAET
jgi:hypothetical protein